MLTDPRPLRADPDPDPEEEEPQNKDGGGKNEPRDTPPPDTPG